MKAERLYKESSSRVIQSRKGRTCLNVIDNRSRFKLHSKLISAIQNKNIVKTLNCDNIIQRNKDGVIQRVPHIFSISVLGGRTKYWIGRRINQVFGGIRRYYGYMQNGAVRVVIRLGRPHTTRYIRRRLRQAGVTVGVVRHGDRYLT